MAQSDALKKYLDAGMAFTHLTRARAEQVVKDLVAAGELQRSQAKSAIDELLDRSRKNAETLAEQVRKEVDEQLAGLGLARKSDVEKLEAELARLRDDKGDDGDGGDTGGGDAEAKQAKPAKAKKAAKKAPPKDEAGFEAPAQKPSAPKRPAAKDQQEDAAAAGGGSMDHSTPAKKAPARAGGKKAPAKDAVGGGGEGKGDQGSGPQPSKAAPAKAAKKPATAAAKPTKEVATAATSPVSTELPGRKANESEGSDDAKPAPAKKAAKGGGDKAGAPTGDKSTPAKKAAKKQG